MLYWRPFGCARTFLLRRCVWFRVYRLRLQRLTVDGRLATYFPSLMLHPALFGQKILPTLALHLRHSLTLRLRRPSTAKRCYPFKRPGPRGPLSSAEVGEYAVRVPCLFAVGAFPCDRARTGSPTCTWTPHMTPSRQARAYHPCRLKKKTNMAENPSSPFHRCRRSSPQKTSPRPRRLRS